MPLFLKRMLWLCVLCGAVFYWQIASIGNMSVPAGEVIIEKGETVSGLPKVLNISPNEFFYKIWFKLSAPDFVLLSGNYQIPQNATFSQVIQTTLTKPQAEEKTITILPGWNIYDIDEYFAEIGVSQAGDLVSQNAALLDQFKADFAFLKSAETLEGFLYPDTYRIMPSATLEQVLRILLGEFKKQIADKYAQTGDELITNLIYASLVEREERVSANRPLVADIMKKRLKEGIALGIDATVCYGWELTQKKCTPAFINAHIFDKNIYNTRKTLGLPPTPIANPSADSFGAVINSEPSPYYYYLHDSSGEIHFAETLQEHASNRVRYLGK